MRAARLIRAMFLLFPINSASAQRHRRLFVTNQYSGYLEPDVDVNIVESFLKNILPLAFPSIQFEEKWPCHTIRRQSRNHNDNSPSHGRSNCKLKRVVCAVSGSSKI